MSPLTLQFDRGTLLCSRWPRTFDPSTLPGMRFDARVGAFRAPARHHAAIRAALAQAGVEVCDAVESPRPVPRLRAPELRPYQAAALEAWLLAGRRGVVVLPTGGGKTRIALGAIAATGLPALCLVPTRVLLEQWVEALRSAFGVPVGCLGDGEHEVRPLTVATFESGYRWMHALGERFALLVVDEAHHFGGGTRDEALEMAIAPWRLGLTATPPRPPAFEALLGPVVFVRTIEDLTGEWLAALERFELRVELSAAERAEYDGAQATFHAVHERFRELLPIGTFADFVRWAARSAAGRQATLAWQRARRIAGWNEAKSRAVGALLRLHREQRTLVFTADAQAAYAVARAHLVMPITADIARAERQEALAAFRRGELRALVAARVLNEGFDVPEASVGIVVGGALGAREHVQRIGRLLRPGPGKRALLYELVARDTLEVGQSRRRRGELARSSS